MLACGTAARYPRRPKSASSADDARQKKEGREEGRIVYSVGLALLQPASSASNSRAAEQQQQHGSRQTRSAPPPHHHHTNTNTTTVRINPPWRPRRAPRSIYPDLPPIYGKPQRAQISLSRPSLLSAYSRDERARPGNLTRPLPVCLFVSPSRSPSQAKPGSSDRIARTDVPERRGRERESQTEALIPSRGGRAGAGEKSTDGEKAQMVQSCTVLYRKVSSRKLQTFRTSLPEIRKLPCASEVLEQCFRLFSSPRNPPTAVLKHPLEKWVVDPP